jgi:tetratricopeptide (TPR) repeat protein
MLFRVFIVLYLGIFAIHLCAQGAGTPTLVQEEINFRSISNSNCVLFHALIEAQERKQSIYNREFSVEPDSYISRDGKKYAQWNIAAGGEPINIKVITIIERLNNESISLGKRKKHTFIETEGDKYFQKVKINQGSLFTLASDLYRRQESETAIKYFDMLIEISPTKFNSYLFKGISLARLGEFDEAMFHLESAGLYAIRDFDKIHVQYAMANYYALKGEKENCLSHLETAVENGLGHFAVMRTDPDLLSILNEQELMNIYEKSKREN